MRESDYEYDFMKYVINKVIPLPVILEKAGFEDGYNYTGNVYCPFHDNTDTPAAKIFQDEDGDRLFCFTERRIYKSSDVIEEGLLKVKLAKIFNRLWKQLSEDRKENLREQYGQPKSYLTDEFKEIIEDMEDFKRGKIDFEDYLGLVLDAMESLKE